MHIVTVREKFSDDVRCDEACPPCDANRAFEALAAVVHDELAERVRQTNEQMLKKLHWI